MSDMDAGSVYMGLAHFTEHAMYMGSEEYPRFSKLSYYYLTISLIMLCTWDQRNIHDLVSYRIITLQYH